MTIATTRAIAAITPTPPADHHSFADHERIVSAIAERDLSGAAAAMRLHLQQVGKRLIPLNEAAE